MPDVIGGRAIAERRSRVFIVFSMAPRSGLMVMGARNLAESQPNDDSDRLKMEGVEGGPLELMGLGWATSETHNALPVLRESAEPAGSRSSRRLSWCG
jgi:hypothetical protein